MALEVEQWTEILTSVNDLSESNIVEQIKEKLQQKYLDTYQEWREYQFDINYLFKIRVNQSTSDDTLLHIAAFTGCEKVAEALLMAEANINVKNRLKRTPLHKAIISGERDVVTLLIEYGANVNAQDREGLTPLGIATDDNIDKEIVSVLVNNGADVNIRDHDGNTPLHSVASYCEEAEEVVKLLIERGINVNVQNQINSTPLHSAVEVGRVEVVQLLVEEYKADVNVMDRDGNTPINLLYNMIYMIENIKNGIEIAKILIESGANFNVPNQEGKTLLHEIVADESHISEHDDYDELVQAIVRYTILQNPEVEKPGYVTAKEEISEYWDEFLDEVRNEISKMRAQRIDGAVAFYDILASKDNNELASYMQNECITTELEAENYKNEFPLYANKIACQFHKGKTRKELLNKGEESIRKLVSIGYGIELPEIVCREIIKYLPNEDIENLNKAAENLLHKKGIKRKASFEEGENSTKCFAASRAEEPNSNLNDTSEKNLNEVRNIGFIS